MIIGMFLGMVMVLGILGIIVMVKMYSDIKELKKGHKNQEEVDTSIFRRIDEVDLSIHRRIDGEINRTDRMYAETNRYINERMDDVHRTLDSRLDKLENKLTGNLGSKQVITE